MGLKESDRTMVEGISGEGDEIKTQEKKGENKEDGIGERNWKR